MANDSTTPAFSAGDEVELHGLTGDPSLNGEHGKVQPKETWPTESSRIGRVAVELRRKKRTIAVKPQNLRLVTSSEAICLVCLEGESDGRLLQLGCGCRNTSGFTHEACAIAAAAAQQERAGTWSGPVGKHPWQLCPTCRLPYTGPLKLALAKEWARRCEPLSPTDLQRFAARTTLGNALSAAGKLAEAETVVRGNLETCAALHGAEHRHTLGTTMNLGQVPMARKVRGGGRAGQQAGRDSDQSPGTEHRDTLATRMQLAGSA